MKLLYKKGYKYQIAEDYRYKLPRSLCKDLVPHTPQDYLSIETKGDDCWLVIHKGYASDGPSGPTFDTKTFMRGAFVHDALYQMIRHGCFIDDKVARKYADKILRDICLEDGMWKVRAWWVYRSLRGFGKPAALPSHIKKIFEA